MRARGIRVPLSSPETLRSPTQARVRLLPVALSAIVLGTAMPVELRSEPFLFWTPNAVDFLVNVLLFLPVGVALLRRNFAAVFLTAGVLSAAVETLQLWHFERYASPFDVVANAMGAGLGWLLAKVLLRKSLAPSMALAIDRRVALVAALTAVALLLAWNLLRVPVDLSTWDDSFELLVRDEATRDRPWQGEIVSVILSTETIDEREIRHLPGRLGLAPGVHLVTRTSRVASADLSSAERGLRPAESELARRFHAGAVETGSFAVVATVKPGNVHQTGPARIVTFSMDQFRRNFDLGQEGRRAVFRVRTPATGDNGMWPHVVTEPALTDAKYVTIVATFDGSVSRVFVDGVLRGRANVEAGGCALPALCDSDLPLGAAVLGMALAVLVLFVVGRTSGPVLVGVALLGGLVAGALALVPFSWMGWPIAGSVGLSAVLGAAAVCLGLEKGGPPAAEGTI